VARCAVLLRCYWLSKAGAKWTKQKKTARANSLIQMLTHVNSMVESIANARFSVDLCRVVVKECFERETPTASVPTESAQTFRTLAATAVSALSNYLHNDGSLAVSGSNSLSSSGSGSAPQSAMTIDEGFGDSDRESFCRRCALFVERVEQRLHATASNDSRSVWLVYLATFCTIGGVDAVSPARHRIFSDSAFDATVSFERAQKSSSTVTKNAVSGGALMRSTTPAPVTAITATAGATQQPLRPGAVRRALELLATAHLRAHGVTDVSDICRKLNLRLMQMSMCWRWVWTHS
jgi:hypothetical protein